MAEEYARAKKILKEHEEGHRQLSELLLEREVIFSEDLEAVFGKRPWASRHDELILQNGNDEDGVPSTDETKVLTEQKKKGISLSAKSERMLSDLIEGAKLEGAHLEEVKQEDVKQDETKQEEEKA